MSNATMKQVYETAKRYAVSVGGVDKNATLTEVCDFGDSYGFMFETGDKYANLYWCVDKKTYRLFSYRPNMDIKTFTERKILPIDIVR